MKREIKKSAGESLRIFLPIVGQTHHGIPCQGTGDAGLGDAFDALHHTDGSLGGGVVGTGGFDAGNLGDIL